MGYYLIRRPFKRFEWQLTLRSWRKHGRPFHPGETTKAKARRERENFFALYCNGDGLDIGYGGDPVVPGVTVFDMEHGDATTITCYQQRRFDFIYTSHLLEHLNEPGKALQHWWQVLKPGGFLILYFPFRDLYERKMELPSRHNPDHKFFYLLDHDEPPHTLGLLPLLSRSLSHYTVKYAKVCDENFSVQPNGDPAGEYSIEAVIQKNLE